MIGIFSAISGIAGTWIKGKNEQQKAKNELKVAELQNKARLMLDKESYNHNWEMEALKGSDKKLKWFSYTLFSLPFIVAIFFPEQVNVYFEKAIHTVPKWWQILFASINGAVWGLASIADVGSKFKDVFGKR